MLSLCPRLYQELIRRFNKLGFRVKALPAPVNPLNGYQSLPVKEVTMKYTERIDMKLMEREYAQVGLEESLKTNLSSQKTKPHKEKDLRWKAIQGILARVGLSGMDRFRLLKFLGWGASGSVYLSRLNGTNCYFAIKVVDTVANKIKLAGARTERDILELLDHPFLPTLYAQFETDRLFFLVMNYCRGGDLSTLKKQQRGNVFPEVAAKFYAAEVLLALEYLHMLGVVYRDLKHENVLVGNDKHIVLSDFDNYLRCASSPTLIKPAIDSDCCIPRIFRQENTLPEFVAEPTAARSTSTVGTWEYLAPEIIKEEGHGSAVDWWTLGIFLYELLCGKTQFRTSRNKVALVSNIKRKQVWFPPESPNSDASRDLIFCLLMKDQQDRVGSKRGATEIKKHLFFEGVNWALIRSARPPKTQEVLEI